MLANLHTRPAFNRSHRFICADNPDAKSGAEAIAQVYGPDALRRAELLAAAPDMLTALKNGIAEIDAYLGATGHVIGVEPRRVALINAAHAMEAAIAKAEGAGG